jgi:hypothetical protein
MLDNVPDRTRRGCCRPSNTSIANVCTWSYDDACLDGEHFKTITVRDSLSDVFAENVADELNKKWGF